MHFLMAFVLLWALFVFVGVPNSSTRSRSRAARRSGPGAEPGPGRPGSQPGDVVVSVDGQRRRRERRALTDGHRRTTPASPVTVVVDRDGADRTLTVTPANGRTATSRAWRPRRARHRSASSGSASGRPVQTAVAARGPGHRPGPQLGQFAWASVAGVGHLFSPSGITSCFDQVTSAKAADQAAANGTRAQSIVRRRCRLAVQARPGRHRRAPLHPDRRSTSSSGSSTSFPMLPARRRPRGHRRLREDPHRPAAGLYHADVTKLMPVRLGCSVLLPCSSCSARPVPRHPPPGGQPVRLSPRRQPPAGRRRPGSMGTMGTHGLDRHRATAHPPDPRGRRGRRRRRPDHGAVDDHHQDGRRRGHPRPDLRPGRGRCRHRALHLQRGGGRRGPGPHRAPLAGADHRRHPLPPRDGAGRPGGRRPGPAAQSRATCARRPRSSRWPPEAKDRGVPIRIGVNAGSLAPRALQALRRGHARGPGRVGPDGAGLLRRGRLRRRQDLGQGLVGPAHDRGLPAGLGDLRPPAAPRGDRGRPAAGRAPQGHGRASPPCWPRASATPSATRSPPTRSKRRGPAASCSRPWACASARASTSSPARPAAGPRST